MIIEIISIPVDVTTIFKLDRYYASVIHFTSLTHMIAKIPMTHKLPAKILFIRLYLSFVS